MKLFHKLILPLRRSMRNRLIVSMILISVVPVLAATLLAMENTRKSMEDELIVSNRSRMEWAGQYMDERLQRLNNLIYSVLYNPSYEENVNLLDSHSLSQQFSAQTNLMDLLTSTLYSEIDSLAGIELYTLTQRKLFYVSNLQFDIFTMHEPPEPWKSMFDQGLDVAIRDNAEQPEQFYLMRTINRFEDRSKLGGISLDVKWSMMNYVLEMANPEQEGSVFIADAKGTPLYIHHHTSDSHGLHDLQDYSETLQNVNGSGYIKNEDHYIFYSHIEPWGLSVVKIVPSSLITDSAYATGRYGLIIGLISVLISAVLALIIAWQTSKPIVRLAKLMNKFNAARPLDSTLFDKRRKPRIDEVGMLESKFNSMTQRLHDHITNEYILNLQKRTAQLKALQAQINPHFLQNTLQMIGGMALSKSPTEIYNVIRALSEMFRYVVRDQSDLSTLGKELDHVRNYMFIQEQRYPGKLIYDFDVLPELDLDKIPAPKLTLQPIVENAFKYALEPKVERWRISMSCRKINGSVEISIQDNGVGMTDETIEALEQRLNIDKDQAWEDSDQIGLQNVNARIKLHFGNVYGLSVRTGETGTRVIVTLPGKSPESSSLSGGAQNKESR